MFRCHLHPETRGQHRWQLPSAEARRAGDATFSLFDASAPCDPGHAYGAASDAHSAQLVGGKLRRNEANNYETLERPAGAGALLSVGACGGMPGQYAEPQGRKGRRGQHAHDAHASSLGGIL